MSITEVGWKSLPLESRQNGFDSITWRKFLWYLWSFQVDVVCSTYLKPRGSEEAFHERFKINGSWKLNASTNKQETLPAILQLHKIFNDVTRKVLSAVIMIKLHSRETFSLRFLFFGWLLRHFTHFYLIRCLIMTLINNKWGASGTLSERKSGFSAFFIRRICDGYLPARLLFPLSREKSLLHILRLAKAISWIIPFINYSTS